jgi:hypothetical protein
MKKSLLPLVTALNTVALLGVAGVYVLVGGEDAPPGAASPPPTAVEAQPAADPEPADRVVALEARVAALEAALERSARDARGGAAGAGAEAPPASAALDSPPAAIDTEPVPGAAPGGEDPQALVRRHEVRALVEAELARARDERRQQAAAAAKPKRTLREVSRELSLAPAQEEQVRVLYQDMEREAMRILFAVEDDAGLEELKAQLAQVELDPALKARLRERVAVNWTRSSSEIGVLYVQLDARLREVMDRETLERFYGFDVELAEREFPDIEETFFRDEEDEDGE